MKTKMLAAVCVSGLVIVLGAVLGSGSIPPGDLFRIIGHKVFGFELPEHIKTATVAIVWNLRLPRTLLAFVAGGAISVSGAVMQSVVRNPLASSYTLGVSSGASFGACLVIFYGAILPVAANFALPVMGFLFGLVTIFVAIGIAQKLDVQMQNHTIILVGMVFSLFVNAVTTLLSALSQDHIQKLLYWQMGSFAMKDWPVVWILAPVTVAGTLFITHYHRELDMMTFGEDQAATMGVPLKAVKRILLIAAAALTGSAIAFCGVIGFIDLVVPHIVRKIFGAAHRCVVPMSAVFGGALMVICDLAARTVASPSELPVGAVTAIIGAPFFACLYFGGRK
ncbi:MAG: iron ABC transporter permease [Planctomycetaceae bacterium]|nr:iron ABC transporter permease [Planctomycetaceae bacterium]